MGAEGSERPRSERVAPLPGVAWWRALWASVCGACAIAVGQWVQSLQAAAACPPGCTDTLAFDVWAWVAVASGAAAALVARGARGWATMAAGALVTSLVWVFVAVYAAAFEVKVMSSLGITALVLVPASAGYLGLRGLLRLTHAQLGAASLSRWRKTTWAILIWTGVWAVVVGWWLWFNTSTYLSANAAVLLWLVGLVILAIPWFLGRRRSDRREQ